MITRNFIRSAHPLEDEQIRRFCPSIFAEAPHESRSDRYAYIPTSEVLAGLRKEGFQPVMACQAMTRNPSRREFTKHTLRLRHESFTSNNINVGDEFFEIILTNSHDGSSSYQMAAGMFRLVCSNGLVCGSEAEEIRIRHSGNPTGMIIDAAFEVIDRVKEIEDKRDEMKGTPMTERQQLVYARAALAYRYEDESPISAEQVLQSRRYADSTPDMWSTFNRVQENLTKGGLSGRNAQGRYNRTRAVKGIDSDMKLNRALWVLTQEFKNLEGFYLQQAAA